MLKKNLLFINIFLFFGLSLFLLFTPRELLLTHKAKGIAHFYQGENLFQKKDFFGARSEYENAKAHGCQNFWVEYRLALTFLETGSSDIGLIELKNFMQTPHVPKSLIAPTFGIGLLKRGYKSEGEEILKECIAKNISPGHLSYQLGIHYKRNGNFKKAKENFLNSFKLGYRQGLTLSHIADILAYQGEAKDAEKFYKKAREYSPDDVNIHLKLGAFYWKENRLFDALNVYSSALSIQPRNPTLWNNLGMVYGKIGNYRQAYIAFRNAIASDPHFMDAYLNLGFFLESIGNKREALEVYKKGLMINPNYEPIKERIRNIEGYK